MKRMMIVCSVLACAVMTCFSACSLDRDTLSSPLRQVYRDSNYVQSFKSVESLRVTRVSQDNRTRITQIVTRDGRMIVWIERMQDDGQLAFSDGYLLVESLLYHIKSSGELRIVREP